MTGTTNDSSTEVKGLTEASYLLKSTSSLGGRPVGVIEVRSGEQTHIKLGAFKEDDRLRGFVIEFTPEPQDDGIVAHIARLDKANKTYDLILHIANYDTKTICAEIKQL